MKSPDSRRKGRRFAWFPRPGKLSGMGALSAVFLTMVAIFSLVLWLAERARPEASIGSVFDALWWAVVTIATVGYGDVYPTSPLGRVLGMAFIVGGVVLMAIVSGTVASMFVERRIREGKGLQDIKMKGHCLVCGWCQDGHRVLSSIEADRPGASVILVAMLEPEGFEAVKAAHHGLDLRFVRGDHTQESTLKKASAAQAALCLLLPDRSGGNGDSNADERTILCALALKAMARGARVRATVLKPESEGHLRRAEVDDVVVHGEFTGYLLSAGTETGLPEAARGILGQDSPSRLRQVAMPAQLVGKSFSEAALHFLESGRGVLIGVMTREKPVTLDDILSDDSGAIDAFIKRKFEEASLDLGSDAKQGNRARMAPDADYVIGPSDAAFVLGGERRHAS